MAALEDALRAKEVNHFTNGSLSDCLTALRRYMEYAGRAGNSGPPHAGSRSLIPASARKQALSEEAREARERPDVVTQAGVRDLLILYGQIMDELRDRKIVRTGNPVGDFAEYLFANAFGWELTDNSSSGHDAEY